MTSQQQQNHTNNSHEIEPIYLHQWIDCCDFHSKWYEAQIIEISKASNKHIKVHYKGWNSKFDTWIDLNNQSDCDRIRLLHTHTLKPPVLGVLNIYEIGAKCHCLDSNDKWYEASIVKISTNNKLLKIHYNNWDTKYDEWINKNSYRIAPLHTMTTSKTPIINPEPPPPPVVNIIRQTSEIKDNDENTSKQHKHKQIQEKYLHNFQPTLKDEQEFRLKLKQKEFIIEDMDEDGNCLFRSISHQIYGTQDFHMILRQKCVEYIESEYEYFAAFVPNGNDKQQFENYCICMKRSGKWGDNIEIQAFSEIYSRSIEIYAYDNKPMKTFTNNNSKQTNKMLCNVPIRLSYHGNSHYNSIINPNEFDNNIISVSNIGELEDEKIKWSSLRSVQASIQTKKKSENEFAEKQLLESVIVESRRQLDKNINIFDPIQILTDKGYSLEMATMAYSVFESQQNKITSETFIQRMVDYIEEIKKASSFGYQDFYLLE